MSAVYTSLTCCREYLQKLSLTIFQYLMLAHSHPAMFNTAVLEVQCQKQINSKLNLYTLVYWFTNKSLLLNPELTSLPKVKENNLRWRRQRILKVKVPMATLTWTTCHKN